MEISQTTDETWEVESGKCTTQEVDCVFKFTEELADLKLESVKQDNPDWMCSQKTEAARPSHGVQTFVAECEPQRGLRHSARVARTASQCGPDHNADIKLTEVS